MQVLAGGLEVRLGGLHRTPDPAEEIDLPGGVQARGKEVGGRDRPRVGAAAAPGGGARGVERRVETGLAQAPAGARLADARRGLFQVEVSRCRAFDQPGEFRVVEGRPPGREVPRIGRDRDPPLQRGVPGGRSRRLGWDVIRSHRGATGQEPRSPGPPESVGPPATAFTFSGRFMDDSLSRRFRLAALTAHFGRRTNGGDPGQGEGHDMPGVGLDIVDSPRAVLRFVTHLRPVPDDHRIDALADDPHLAEPHLLLRDLRAEELANQLLGPLLQGPDLLPHHLLQQAGGVGKLPLHEPELPVVLVGDAVEQGRDLPPQALFRRRIGGHAAVRGMSLHGLGKGVPPGLAVQGLLAAEMVVDGGDVGPGLQADLRDRRIPETLLRKDLARGRQQLAAGPCRILSRDLHPCLS